MKACLLTVLIFACSLSLHAQAPPWLWAKSAGGAAGVCAANSVAVDASGNSYVAGLFGGPSITFGTTTLFNANPTSGSYDMFVVKYDPAGAVLWARAAGGVYSDGAWGIAADSGGNCYVTGNFSNTAITFGSATLTTNTTDIFVVKYNTSGTVVWAKQSGGGAGTGAARAIAVDKSGACYVTGFCSAGSVTFGSTTLTGTGFGDDAFIVKYDASGAVAWATRPSGFYTETGLGIAADGRGACYVTGRTESAAVDFGNGVSLTFPGQAARIFTTKYGPAGNAVWARSTGYFGGAESGTAIAADSIGNAYVTGYFDGSIIAFDTVTLYSAGQRDAFLLKYDTSGGVAWARSAGGITDDAAAGITVDAAGATCVTGSFDGTAAFDTTILASGGVTDAFVAKFDDTGAVVWARSVGGIGGEFGYGIAVDRAGNSIIAGRYTSPSAVFGTTTLTTSGGEGAFTAKLAACDPPLPRITRRGDTLSTTDTFAAYQWYLNGRPVPGATGQTYVAAPGGSYYVIVQNANRCSGISDTLSVPLGIEGAYSNVGVSVYPNPAGDEVHVALGAGEGGSVTLCDLTGRVLHSAAISDMRRVTINTRNLPAGIYLLSYRTAGGAGTVKLIRR